MIEIILAIAIIAIGISSVMVLFTSGLRKSNEAVTANTMPDAAETLLAAVRQAALSYAQENGWGAFDTQYTALNTDGWSESKEPGLKISDFGSNLEKNGSLLINRSDMSILYRQLTAVAGSEYVTEFSAIAEVRRCDNPADLVFSHPQTPAEKLAVSNDVMFNDADGGNALSKCRKVLSVRVSYPAHLPMSERESKIYRIEIFNDKYDRFLL